MLRLTPPEVAVTVSVNVPAGVPIAPPPPPPPPPGDPPLPQEVHSAANSTIAANLIVAIRMTDATGRVARNPPFRFRVFSAASRATATINGSHGCQGSPDGGPGGGPSIDPAVVVTVTVAVESVVPSSVTDVGEMVQVAAVMFSVQVSDTFPEKPSGERVRS